MPADDSAARRALLQRKREFEDERKVQDHGSSLFCYFLPLKLRLARLSLTLHTRSTMLAGWRTQTNYTQLPSTASRRRRYLFTTKQPSGGDWTDASVAFVSADEPPQGDDADVPSLAALSLNRRIPTCFGRNGGASATFAVPGPALTLPFGATPGGAAFGSGSYPLLSQQTFRAQTGSGLFGPSPSALAAQQHPRPSLFDSVAASTNSGSQSGGVFDRTDSRGISSGIAPNMRVTALGEKIVHRDSSGLSDDVHLSAEERASISSDVVGNAVPIASLVLNAAFAWVCVPRSRVAVFVECRSRNTSAHTLVAGPLAVYVDGKQVAKNSLKARLLFCYIPDAGEDIKTQDTIVAPLGVDDAVHVMHRGAARTEGQGPSVLDPQIAITVKAVHEKDPNAAGVDPE
ncbi:uncharacterized protein C8Q71DRAFT_856590 [Rhodofomes roseus]|uniref:Uncharacterized protein n=1 Tax=Rhodofomes roseus TaxID=34475 RepID=A0ABQ8KKK0_9APHY|nr:uncharacterized protein C8Q71DRAFT_856590 [Rhodofomes roseus]KAH9838657.1 hypothetical protein C8Q71DRAFT_856590 [Rhodofomes roseus]